MVKYKQFYTRMLNQNEELFRNFTKAYEDYTNDSSKKSEFDEIGREVNMVVKRTENKLCMQTDIGKFSNFSSNLADKFWVLVRENYPYIDKVGVETKK